MTLWLAVAGYEGRYEISDDGQVRSLMRQRLRKTRICKKTGYERVWLWDGGNLRPHLVHRLVAIAFLGDPESGMEVCHNDGSRTNNCVANLRWDTRAGNQADRKVHGTGNWAIGEKHGRSKLTDADARRILVDPRPQKSIASEFGISQASVSNIKRGANWGHIREQACN